jgi:pseudaminic acid biosynthesis-associated methylase
MSNSTTENPQLQFWRGQFGDDFVGRNLGTREHMQARISMWADILRTIEGARPDSILEVGSNVGNNLRAISALSSASLLALEPNQRAREQLVGDGVVAAANALDGFAGNIPLSDAQVDLAFTSGVLIHIHSDDLLQACREIHRVTRRYIVTIEYFADRPESIPYRGHEERLFKRDFGSFWLDNFSDLRVLNYGFAWKRMTGLDNLTWWVFEKT